MTCRWCWKILFITFIAITFILNLPRRQRLEKSLINADLLIYSFNPTILHLTFNSPMISSDYFFIMDKHLLLFHLSNLSMITMIFSEGYHQLDLIVRNSIEQIEYYQTMKISTGSEMLMITVVNNQSQSMNNVFVHLELVNYPHIYLDSQTNAFGQVTFTNLPRILPLYIEAICQSTKSHAYLRIERIHERNVTLMLKENSQSYDVDEYDSFDRGYYSI